MVWKGYLNNIWDVGTSLNTNWMNPSTLAATFYGENSSGGPAVIFDDSATSSTAVTLGVTVKPTSVTYWVGAIGLTKNGTGTFTLGTSNDFTGNTTINAGTLALTGGDNRLPATTAVFSTNATLNLGGNSQKLAAITMASPSVQSK